MRASHEAAERILLCCMSHRVYGDVFQQLGNKITFLSLGFLIHNMPGGPLWVGEEKPLGGWAELPGPRPPPRPPPLSVHTDAGPPCDLQSHVTQLARAGPRQQTRVLLIAQCLPRWLSCNKLPGAPRASVSHHMGQRLREAWKERAAETKGRQGLRPDDGVLGRCHVGLNGPEQVR